MKTILFVCVENAGRSQMAEGFFNKYAPPGYHAVSAGTKPAGRINPFVVQAMNDIGIDINNQKSKIIADEMIRILPEQSIWAAWTGEIAHSYSSTAP